MAKATAQGLNVPPWVHKLETYRPLFVPIAFISLLAVVLVPLPPVIMDLLIASNVSLAMIILLTTIFIERPLDLSSFPSILLGMTLFRLVLNIATTRMILSAEADNPDQATAVAGEVIEAFAYFVTGDSLVVGLVLFLILIIVQFVVITKGATRISEVAARFTLDGMPGKQMAIDADLNAGTIDENEARKRREEIGQEADFYGAMDGAAKFVRGDAIAGIIITLVNIVGGFGVGVLEKGWTMQESLAVFTRLTIGDGLVSQLPAFVIAVGSALVVTRSGSRNDLGSELIDQLAGRRVVLGLTAGFLAAMSFTGLPMLPMMSLALVFAGMAFYQYRQANPKAKPGEPAEGEAKPTQAPVPTPEEMLGVDTMELEIGYGLVRLVDTTQGGDLLDRISAIRRQLAGDMGLVIPPVRIRDNMQLQPAQYNIKVRGNTVATGIVHPGKLLAMDSGLASDETLQGIATKEPAFGLNAVWIDPGQKQRAESLNYTVVDPASVLATHLTELVKDYADELITREETNNLIEQAKQKAPKLFEEVVGADKPIKPGDLQKILQNLLRERVPIKDLETIVETLGDWAGRTKDLDILTEYVRNALRRTICNLYAQREPADPNSLEDDPTQTVARLHCISLDPALEDQINAYIDRGPEGTSVSIPPALANRITARIVSELQNLVQQGHHPVVLTSPQVRAQVFKLLEPHMSGVAVLGYNEVSKGVHVECKAMVQVEEEQPRKRAGRQGQGAEVEEVLT